MPTLVARVAPQRSSQYASLASLLAPAELALSPLAAESEPVRLAGQPFLTTSLPAIPEQFPYYATLSEWYEHFDTLAGMEGPFLRPLDRFEPLRYEQTLVEARRYRGKTNEMLSALLVNLARWHHSGPVRWLLDPMAGGGTILFAALRLGYHVMGVESDRKALEGAGTFLTRYMEESRRPVRVQRQRRRPGTRHVYELADGQQGVLAVGDSREAPALLADLPGGPAPDLIVTDLPYSIQHRSRGDALLPLLDDLLPLWHSMAAPDAVLALAWNRTRTPRETLVTRANAAGWDVATGGAYERLVHQVDRVIKQRDLLVARRIAPA